MRLLLASCALLLALSACTRTDQPVGSYCSTDENCQAGLVCMEVSLFAGDGGCAGVAKACTKTCTSNAECSSLEAGAMCFDNCSGPMTCGLLSAR